MEAEKLWWCTSHKRLATHIRNGKHECDPKLAGILMPCFVVEIDDKEAQEDPQSVKDDS